MKQISTWFATFLMSASMAVVAVAADSPASTTGPGGQASPDRVSKLFEVMRAGKYQEQVLFPELEWEDIPALLKLGGSKIVLKTFPREGLSSQYEPECSEGMVALWLIEGLRLGKRPPLNALCLPPGPFEGNWGEVSEKNHQRVLQAYRTWWSKVQLLPREKAMAADPLDGAKLYWHGSPSTSRH